MFLTAKFNSIYANSAKLCVELKKVGKHFLKKSLQTLRNLL